MLLKTASDDFYFSSEYCFYESHLNCVNLHFDFNRIQKPVIFTTVCSLQLHAHLHTEKNLEVFSKWTQSVCCANFSHNFPCWWLIDLVFFAIGATYACTFVHWNMLEVSWKLPASTLNCLHLYSKLQKGLRLWLLLYVPAHPIVCIHITSFSSIPY